MAAALAVAAHPRMVCPMWMTAATGDCPACSTLRPGLRAERNHRLARSMVGPFPTAGRRRSRAAYRRFRPHRAAAGSLPARSRRSSTRPPGRQEFIPDRHKQQKALQRLTEWRSNGGHFGRRPDDDRYRQLIEGGTSDDQATEQILQDSRNTGARTLGTGIGPAPGREDPVYGGAYLVAGGVAGHARHQQRVVLSVLMADRGDHSERDGVLV